MIPLGNATKVFLAVGVTDMRKAINGLSQIVADQLLLDPFSGHLFAFCNRRRTIVKILLWDRNGFWLCQKRLEKHTFKWPKCSKEVLDLSPREFGWLLDGLEFTRLKGHGELSYSTIV